MQLGTCNEVPGRDLFYNYFLLENSCKKVFTRDLNNRLKLRPKEKGFLITQFLVSLRIGYLI